MRNLWIAATALIVTGCSGGIGNMNTHTFVATPVPDEIRIVVYSTETSAGTNTWHLNNDNLRIRHTSKVRNGKIILDRTRKMTPNDYNWVVYNLEQAKFTKVKSAPIRRQSRGNETLKIITQDEIYSYSQNSNARFPNGFQKIINVIPGLSNAR